MAISFKEKYGEKPVEWLEKEFGKPTEQIRTDLQDLLCYWDNYIEEKEQMVRSKKTVDRINNVRYTVLEFKQTKRDPTSGNIPVVGLNNDTTIKRLKDFTANIAPCRMS